MNQPTISHANARQYGFLGPLYLHTMDQPLADKPFKLLRPLPYRSQLVRYLEVPSGYRTDFASVPRFFWRIFPPMGRYARSAVVHDYLCDVSPKVCDHKTAAAVFREAMAHAGVPRWKRKAMHRAVVWFGPKFKGGDD